MSFLASIVFAVSQLQTANTALASETQSYVYMDVSIPKAPWVSGGDADVCTKKNRTTTYSVTISQLQISNGVVSGIVTYEVKEAQGDQTGLEGQKPFRIAASGWTSIAARARSLDGTLRGKNHNWNRVATGNSYFEDLHVRVDGGGDDDEGNAQMRGRLAIPVN